MWEYLTRTDDFIVTYVCPHPVHYRGLFSTARIWSGMILQYKKMDSLSPQERSERMSRVKGRDTRPERVVRKLVSSLGFRYRLSPKNVSGRPDLTFHGRRKAVFVHGCFWHRHSNCRLARIPKSRVDFWLNKLEGNRQRDKRNLSALRGQGWSVLTIWECELGKPEKLRSRLKTFLEKV